MKGMVHPGKVMKAACYSCRKPVDATFDYGSVVVDEVVIEGVMRATCNVCGSVVATAQQSAPLIRATLDGTEKSSVRQTTVRIPRVLADYARQTLYHHNAPDPERFDLLLRAYVATLVGATTKRREQAVRRLRAAHDVALELPCDYQLPLYLTQSTYSVLDELRTEAGAKNLSEIVRRILVTIESDKKTEGELLKLVVVG